MVATSGAVGTRTMKLKIIISLIITVFSLSLLQVVSMALETIPDIGIIAPHKMYPGQSTILLISSKAIDFKEPDFPQDTVVSLGEDIITNTIDGLEVNSLGDKILLSVEVSKSAQKGFRDIMLTSALAGDKVISSAIEIVDRNELNLAFSAKSVVDYAFNSNGVVGVIDYNRDGNRDIVVSQPSWHKPFIIFKGLGDREFEKVEKIVGKKKFFFGNDGMIVGDFNGDGKEDVIELETGDSEDNENGNIFVFYAKDESKKKWFKKGNKINSRGIYPTTILKGNFKKDSKDDFIVINKGRKKKSGNVQVFLGRKNGFKKIRLKAGNHPSSGFVIDVNSDAHDDIVVKSGNKIFSFLGNGKGDFKKKVSKGFKNEIPFSYSFMDTGDFTGEGDADIALRLIDNTGEGIHFYSGILSGDGKGQFTYNGIQENMPQWHYKKDINQDGIDDLISAETDGVFTVFTGNQIGTYETSQMIGPAPIANSVKIADLDKDDKLDFILLADFGNEPPAIFILFNDLP